MSRVLAGTVVLAICAALAANAARGDEVCHPPRLTVLDGGDPGSDHLLLPATFNGRQTRLLLDTGGGWSVMKEALAKELGYPFKRLRTLYFVDAAGGKMTHYVAVPTFTLGNVRFGASDFVVMADNQGLETYGGTIGSERLTDYDVEIDNATKMVTLYRSDPYCSGRLVHWANEWVEIPYTFNDGVPELRVTLDNAKIRAVFDTGSSDTLMDLDVAQDHFRVTPQTPGVEKIGEQVFPSGKKVALYEYTFKTLTVSAIKFEDVRVTLGDFDDTQLVLGMNEIRHLHLYIASKRKVIYVTRAEKQTGREVEPQAR